MNNLYPYIATEDATETISGVSFEDPYRPLEVESDEVLRWQRAQAELAAAHVREWPSFEQVRRWVARCRGEPPFEQVVLPRYVAGQWFRRRFIEGASQAQAVISDSPMGDARVLFDPTAENPARPPFLSWLSPSPDGKTLAIGVCADGSENNTIRLIDVATGTPLPEPPPHILMDSATGGVQWLPDSSGFFFSAIAGQATSFDQQVYLHRREPTPTTALVDIPWTEAREYRWVVVSRDGRYAVAMERHRNPLPVAVTELREGTLRWRSFVTAPNAQGTTVVGHIVGDRYVAVTDVGARRGRLVAIPVGCENPNDIAAWRELVPESQATMRSVTWVGEALYVSEFVDTYARIRIVDFNGSHLGEVPLPGRGAVGAEWWHSMLSTLPRGHPNKFLFAFSSLTVSTGLYMHTPGQVELETLKEPEVRFERAVVEDHWAVSADGTRIPFHLVRPADMDVTVPQPTLIHAYGGHYVPWTPQFPGPLSGTAAAFIAAGGVYVHAHLRGGGEFGLDWWEGGRLRNKQNCYDDLYAIAESLIGAKRCTPRKLALTGNSNGGLTAGVALTQRPDLWAVVVPRVPMLDLIGACRNPYSRMVTILDRANVDDPEEVRRLATFSPYHLIRNGICYPAVFVEAGSTDPRCPVWHARKFVARLQRATVGPAPILLHVWEGTGHGQATDQEVGINQHTEWLSFTMRHLGMHCHPEASRA